LIAGGQVGPPVDTHAHLAALPDPLAAITRARRTGLAAVVGVGEDLASNRKIWELSQAEPDLVWPALGAHPWALEPEGWRENLEFVSRHLKAAAALGEVGLDYRVKVKKELQRQVLAEALDLARRWDKPVLLHSRFSQGRCLEMLERAGIRRAVFHWYSGPLDVLEKILAAGYFISSTPALAYSPPHRAAIARAPVERILVETDAPVKYQGQESEPADVLWTIRLVAEVKGLSYKEAEETTTRNARLFFGR